MPRKGNCTPQGHLVGFALEHFPHAPRGETLGLIKRLLARWPLTEVEAMVKGAARLGWKSLRGVSSQDGLGRRWAQAAYWQSQNAAELPQSVRDIFRQFA